jgi:hypothetical protein
MSDVVKKPELHDSPALESYAKWRPRLRRGASWAFPVAAVGKAVGGEARTIVPLTIAAGMAGAADATLEEKLRQYKDHKARALVQRGFEEKHMSSKKASVEDASLFPDAAVTAAEREASITLTGLTRKRDELSARANSQLSDYFPSAAKQSGSYGRGLRVTTGHGSIAQLLAGSK